MDDLSFEAAYHLLPRDGSGKLTRRMVINLADDCGMTPRETVLRAERQGLCRRGSWDWFAANGGITRDHIAEVRATRPTTGDSDDRT